MTASKNIEAVNGIIPPKKGEEIILPQPYGSADSLLLSRWIRQMNLKKSGEGIKNLIICSNQL